MVSQPKPELERSPYFEIVRNYGVEIDFRSFIQIEPIPSREFRKNRIDILSYGAVILTSKNAVDHYFRMCGELRIIVPETMKYFCISDATAYYLQKYIQFRKRKIFSGNYSFAELVEIIKKKHKEEKFLLPCAVDSSEEYTEMLDKEGIRYVKAPMYKAIYSELTDINFSEYDLLVLFSSAGLSSLLHSHPEFRKNNIKIAAFGEQTAEAILDAGLNLHIHAPQPHAPSMAMALEMYLKGEQSNQPWQQIPFSKKPTASHQSDKQNKNKTVHKPTREKVSEPKQSAPDNKTKKPAVAAKQTAHPKSSIKPAPLKTAPQVTKKGRQSTGANKTRNDRKQKPQKASSKIRTVSVKKTTPLKKEKATAKNPVKAKKGGSGGKKAKVAPKRKR